MSILETHLFLQIFIGQVMGTSVGTHIFVHYGWRATAVFSMGLYGWQVFVLLLRGPHCKRYTWFGYEGGLEAKRKTGQNITSRSDKTNTGDASPGDDGHVGTNGARIRAEKMVQGSGEDGRTNRV